MTALRQKAALLVILILIASTILTKPAERGNALSFSTPSHYSNINTSYHPVHLITCPPPPFEC